jgi:hypothetical protein
MSWSIAVNGGGMGKEAALDVIARQVSAHHSYSNEKQRAVVDAAAEFLRQVIAQAPEGATFDLYIGGHTDDDGLVGTASARVASMRPPTS